MSIHEIRVFSPETDPLAEEVLREAHKTLGMEHLERVKTAKVYRLEGITDEQAQLIADRVLSNDTNEVFEVNNPDIHGASRIIDIGYKPGVMDPAEESLLKAAGDLGVKPIAVGTSTEYAFFGQGVSEVDVENVASRFLMNQTVEQVIIESPKTLVFEGTPGDVKVVPIRFATTDELMDLSKDKLFLDESEMKTIQHYFRKLARDPKDAELETIAARESDHCRHKTFNANLIIDGKEKQPLFPRIKERAEKHFKNGFVISAFSDNSGVISAYDGFAFAGKVETHNSPSAIEPYGGAGTGVGGVVRDIAGTGKGAKNIISTFMYCFAPPNTKDSDLPPGTLRPDYIQRRVIKGVGDYGNRMGIPTGNGSVHYHADFRAKPTVMVGAYGLIPEKYAKQGKPQVGDLVVTIGGRTGRDGIHGATFSSGEMTDRTQTVNSNAVQIGNAIEEKRMFDALIEARDSDLISAITDCGAAGFCSAIGELGEETGVYVDMQKAPLKYPGLAPWEIWLSESQERMVAAIAPDHIEEFIKICGKYNVEATVLGEFDGNNNLTVNYGGQNIVDLDYDFLKNGFSGRIMHGSYEPTIVEEKTPNPPKNQSEWIERLGAVLSHGNVCSKEEIFRQYDHGVQGGNIVPPYGGADQSSPNDALVIRPILDKQWGIVQSHGMNPVLNTLDPYEGTVWAIADAAAKFVSVGGNLDEAAAVGNYVWPFPDKKALGSLDRSVDAACDMMDVLELPVISGKDSLSSTYRGKDGTVIEIPPVYTMSIFGRIPDVEKTITSEIKKAGSSSLYLIGLTSDGMGGSVYYDTLEGSTSKFPKVNTKVLPKTLNEMQKAIQSGKILASHAISEGGLIATIAEMSFGSNSGAHIVVPDNEDPEKFLFGATAGCFVVEISEDERIYEIFGNIPIQAVGITSETNKLEVWKGRNTSQQYLFGTLMTELKKVWQAPLKETLQ